MPYRETRSLRKDKQKQAAAKESSREKRRQASLRRLARSAAILALLAAAVVAGWAALGPVRLSAVTDFRKTVGRRGEGWPIETGSGSVLQAAPVGDSLTLLWPTALEIRNPAGYRGLHLKQAYTDPAIRACGPRLLQFDRASGKLALLGKTGPLHEQELPRALFCAGLNRRGDTAAACRAEGAASELAAWDTRGAKAFGWRCEREYPAALQPAKNGRGLAACLIGTDQAGIYARFVAFDYDKDDPVTDLRLPDAWLYGAAQRGNSWLAVGDRAAYLIKSGAGAPEPYPYEGRALQAFSLDERGWCAVLLEDWDNRALLRVYDQRGALALEQGFARRPQQLVCDRGSVYLRFDSALLRWNKRTGFRQGALPEGTQEAFPAGGAAYAITVRSVERVPLKWHAAEEGLF
ncbi:MAG: hypothetical protein FWE98_06125 [Oscillospiraceae bacterium]|nr:hypothetical protein [Oscillospiraceae bacterium]